MQEPSLKPSSDIHRGWGEEVQDELGDRTITWLAHKVDVHPTTILRIIRGEICPNDELKLKIAGALGVRMDKLWAWPKIVPPDPNPEQQHGRGAA